MDQKFETNRKPIQEMDIGKKENSGRVIAIATDE